MDSDSSLAPVTARVMALTKDLLGNAGIHRDFAAEESLVDVGVTSIDLVNLMVAMEAEFDIMIPQAQLKAANFTSVASMARMLASLGCGAPSGVVERCGEA